MFVRDKFFLRHGEGCITWNVIFIVYKLIDNSSRPMGGRISTVSPESHKSVIFCSRKKLLKSSEKWVRPRVWKTCQSFANRQIFANLRRNRCPTSEASKFWQNKHSCFSHLTLGVALHYEKFPTENEEDIFEDKSYKLKHV